MIRICRNDAMRHPEFVAGKPRVPSAGPTEIASRAGATVTARGACLLHGFTLVELLVVIAIIGILVALLLAGRASGPSGGAALAVREQFQASWIGPLQLRERSQNNAAWRNLQPESLLGGRLWIQRRERRTG